MESEKSNQTVEQTNQVIKAGRLHQVTPLSKYLAMALFIILPFLGAWIGYMYSPEKIVKVERISEVSTSEYEENDRWSFNASAEQVVTTLDDHDILFTVSAVQFSNELRNYRDFLEYDKETGLVYLDGYFRDESQINLIQIFSAPEGDGIESFLEDIKLSQEFTDNGEEKTSEFIRQTLATIEPETDHSTVDFRSFCNLKRRVNGNDNEFYNLDYDSKYEFDDFGAVCGNGEFVLIDKYLIYVFPSGFDAHQPQVNIDSISVHKEQ